MESRFGGFSLGAKYNAYFEADSVANSTLDALAAAGFQFNYDSSLSLDELVKAVIKTQNSKVKVLKLMFKMKYPFRFV